MSLEERLFKSFDDQQKVEHEAREIETLINSFEGSAGLYPISVNSLENPFMEDYQTFASDKTLSLIYCEEAYLVDTWSSCSVKDFSKVCYDWRKFYENILKK